jgi:hypothetical protein
MNEIDEIALLFVANSLTRCFSLPLRGLNVNMKVCPPYSHFFCTCKTDLRLHALPDHRVADKSGSALVLGRGTACPAQTRDRLAHVSGKTTIVCHTGRIGAYGAALAIRLDAGAAELGELIKLSLELGLLLLKVLVLLLKRIIFFGERLPFCFTTLHLIFVHLDHIDFLLGHVSRGFPGGLLRRRHDLLLAERRLRPAKGYANDQENGRQIRNDVPE